jgi:hypothetical protein
VEGLVEDLVEVAMSELEAGIIQGRTFSAGELSLVRDVVQSCAGLSRTELALTVCELLEWRRPNGELKGRECREVIEDLERRGWLVLPAKRAGRPAGRGTTIPKTLAGEYREPLVGSVREVEPVLVEPITDNEGHSLFRELVGRYHPLGYRVPFGAQVRYLVKVSRPSPAVVGVVQFSSPAWRMSAREGWIGWDDEQRRRNLQRVINNSRFLVLPWVQVSNLGSKVLALAIRRAGRDWAERYGVEPFLAETLVDTSLYHGGCYRAANWIEVGSTTGRGRMDREHTRHGVSPKRVFVYPLVRDAARRLREQ